ncbi:MAG TPA: DUF3352 domain-containing protein [Anaerolineae bacterium]|nr:DUF3352 domain-containing protein [Anaerolineae bacterium]
MFCTRCGGQNNDTARFCIHCGAPLEIPGVAASPQDNQAEPPRSTARAGRGLRRWLIAFGALALVLLCLCGAATAGAYFWLGLHRTDQTAEIVPADTPLFISFSPSPRQARYFRDVESLEAMVPVFGAMPELRETAEKAQSDLLTQFDIDWQQDILPWIGGEIGLALIDIETNDDISPMILTVATRNEKKSDAFLQKVRRAMEQEGSKFETETYRDIPVMYVVPDYEGAFAPAFATFEHLIVVGTNRKALHRAIDIAQNKDAPVLADQEVYQAVLNELPDDRLGYIYLDGPTFLNYTSEEADISVDLKALRGAGVSFGLARDGVRFDYVVSYNPDLMTPEQRAAQSRPVHRLKTANLTPAATIAYWSTQDLPTSWKAFMSTMQGASDIEDLVQAFENETGVHLIDDILAQMTGEVTLVILPDRNGLFGDEETPLGLLLLAQTDDPVALKASLDDLADYLVDEIEAELDQQEIGDTTFTMLEESWSGLSLGYGFVDDVLVLGTSAETLQEVAQTRDESLAATKTFQAALDPLPNKSSSYLFLNVPKAIRLASKMMDEDERAEFNRDLRPYLDPIQALSLGTEAMDRNGMMRGTLYLYTKGRP